MARLVGPVSGPQLAYQIGGDNRLSTAGTLTATVYSDAAGTQLADIITYPAGAAIPGSQLTVPSTSLLPLFQFPNGVDTVYVSVNGGPLSAVYAKGSTSSAVGVFDVTAYGAKGDGATDDTAAINSAIAAAVTAGQANGTNYAEVYFPPLTYVLSSATTKTAANKGNAQIWLPLVAATAQKFTLVLRGVRSATALPHWQQTNVQRSGSVLKSTLTGQAVDGTFGPPSVVGGPTPAQGYGFSASLFNNMLIVLDGLSVVTPTNPTVMAFDFSGMAQANVISASANASTTPGSGVPPACTSSWAYGVYMPQMLNNDLCNVYDFSCEGFYSGLTIAEHTAAVSIRAIYCVVGITVIGNMSDSIWIGYASIEACQYDVQMAAINGGTGATVKIDLLDVEEAGAGNFNHVYTVDDGSNNLRGEIGVHILTKTGTQGGEPTVNGATKVKIRNLGTAAGASSAITLPASTVASTPYFRDAAIVVTGGTSVSAVSVDGVAQGFTATPYTIFVPAGKTFAITYSSAPTIKVTLL